MNSDETPLAKPKSSEATENREEISILKEEAEVSEMPPTEPFFVKMMQNEVVEGTELASPQREATEEATAEPLKTEVDSLTEQKKALKIEIQALKSQKQQLIVDQTQEVQQTLRQMVKEGLRELEEQRQALEVAIEQLERRRDRIRAEMRTTFAGVSQELAIRLQGFKDYLVGSLQDLAASAEQLELPTGESWSSAPATTPAPPTDRTPKVQFAQPQFEDQTRQIQRILEQYRTRPDYYGSPWQLRRTFEPIHAERLQTWFFSQGGRGAIRSMGSRLQNILIASAAISVLYSLYSDRVRTLILANTPERLGEWRRGLQDCLGISRSDFGPERGVVLFESSEALVQKADRVEEDKLLPFVIIDETEDPIDLSLLQFPLWLAFARDPQQMSSYTY